MRIELLLRNDAFFEQKPVAFKIDFGVLALRLILGELTLGLFELDLEGTRINLREEIPLMHVLTFAKSNIDELPVYAAAHGYGVEGGYGSQAVEVDRRSPCCARTM